MSIAANTPSFGLRLAALDARLDAHSDVADDASRALLKSEIVDLFRAVDRELSALAALKEEVKGLVAKWKQLPMVPMVPMVPMESEAAPLPIALTSTRVDHLGASTFVAKGWMAISIGDYVAAESALARALELAPDDLEAAALLGWALMGQTRYDDALVALQGVLARDPSHALARANVGFICLQKGIYGEAIEHLVRAARVDADRKAALYATFYLGLVYQRREMYDDAVAFFQRALALGPNLTEARYELGRAFWFGGDRTTALEAWRAGASAGKFNGWAKRCAAMCETIEQGGAPPPVETVAAI